ncbi:MAG: sigma-70 family RNA polymerase sigma factor [Peptococcaceae bacterium]|jgi:RNA polymerase sigma-70 factor (ECF subfamily)|nr:sigma-70 family RNA polymerase sigma factor [Peptococcaceae bacterium]
MKDEDLIALLIALIKRGKTEKTAALNEITPDRIFEILAERYEKKVYSLAWRLTGNREDAGDLAQEAFLKAWRSIGQFRGDAAFGTWMTHIVTNLWRDSVRKRRVNYESLDDKTDQIPSAEAGPEAVYERRERQEGVQGLINELAPEYKLVLVLRDIEGYTYTDIADMTGLPLGTVKSRISRARERLKELLKAAGI